MNAMAAIRLATDKMVLERIWAGSFQLIQGFNRQMIPQANTPVVKSDWEKTGRNEPCPCGSGKKYKHCHGR